MFTQTTINTQNPPFSKPVFQSYLLISCLPSFVSFTKAHPLFLFRFDYSLTQISSTVMASSMIISKRAPAKLILPCLQSLVSPVTMRRFSTSAEREYSDDRSMEIDRRSDQSPVSRRRESPGLFGDVFDPFIQSSRSLSQILNMMDQMMESPFATAWRGMGGRTGWDVKEDENALYLRIDMPGLAREQVKVSAEQNTLIIKGEGEAESGEEEGGRKYSSRIDLPEKLYKVEDIRAEMKNGVLKVVVPKVKEDERKDVFQIKVD